MKANEIENVLNNFINDKNYKCILINGTWGIGKTYYLKQFVSKHKTNSFDSANDKHLSKNTVKNVDNMKKNVIYMSAYGIKSINDLKMQSLPDTIENLYKYTSSFTSILKKSMKKILQFMKIPDFDIDLSVFYRLFIDKVINDADLIVIDDFERIDFDQISIKEILGFIDSISQKHKVAIISNLNKIDNMKDWEEYKEKTIDKIYTFNQCSDEAYKNILERCQNDFNIEKIIEYVKEIYSKNIAAKANTINYKHEQKDKQNEQESKTIFNYNLRYLEKALYLYEEIIIKLDNVKSDKKLSIFKVCFAVVIYYYVKTNFDDYSDIEPNKDIQYDIYRNYLNSISDYEYSIIMPIYNLYCNGEYKNIEIVKDIIENAENSKDSISNIEFLYLSDDIIAEKAGLLWDKIVNHISEYKNVIVYLDDVVKLVRLGNDNLIELPKDFEEKIIKNISYFIDYNKSYFENSIDYGYFKSKDIESIITKGDQLLKDMWLDYQFVNSKSFSWIGNIIMSCPAEIEKKFMTYGKNNNYYIPQFDDVITDDIWANIHRISEYSSRYFSEESKKIIYEMLIKQSGKSKIGEKRMNALKEQYFNDYCEH